MPNVLVLSFEGFSFSSRQLYEHLSPKLLSRAAVHESLTVEDALHWIHSGWPNVVLVTDSVISLEEHQNLLITLVDYTKHGCITVLVGLFAPTVELDRLDGLFNSFGLQWRAGSIAQHRTKLVGSIDKNIIRIDSLVASFDAEALFLADGVSTEQVLYQAAGVDAWGVYAAFGRVGLGKLGYVGDTGYGEEAERLILSMCHLDRPEERLQAGVL
ncbi:uncharacterized protein K460DRAFT_363520 [Cucurbitaria berberidis CBS 394.84]|uniref:Uncharacterized protein n=1 Tax=Cucurbitaria berberidis CBS 394.84 TaxID=1168544 RepID=A0A9P4LAQ9_9PLEO|nr:uncharacterized protein K460DRAFT_363520 [Cucurbitaria berberidis CBS 394.84]KAF1847444.1 hypothetical protein K460DRAFT_363520 [Cucurbitaria berberidis CBS 394.84]